jgi:hypothetical protein
MELINALAILAYLFSGLWLWRHLRRLGIGGLLATALALVILWFVSCLVQEVYVRLVQTLARVSMSFATMLPIVVMIALLVVVLAVLRLWLLHERARRFFDL